jgi:hypothetical protein
MKVGDKLLCKRNFIDILTGYVCITINKKYILKEIFENGNILVIDDVNDDVIFHENDCNYRTISDYFYTNIEIRLLKLKSI